MQIKGNGLKNNSKSKSTTVSFALVLWAAQRREWERGRGDGVRVNVMKSNKTHDRSGQKCIPVKITHPSGSKSDVNVIFTRVCADDVAIRYRQMMFGGYIPGKPGLAIAHELSC